MTRRSVCLCASLAALSLASLPDAAMANTTEDVLGLGGRTSAMGGAGTALANDPTAAYFGPANLAFCGRDTASFELHHTSYSLDVGLGPTDPPAKGLRDQTRMTFGLCSQMPYGLAIGILFGMNLQNPMTLDTSTLVSEPQFALYGDPLEQLSIMVGGAWRPAPWISVGIGASILVNSVLSLDAFIPVAEETGVFSNELRWDLDPTAALMASVHVEPTDSLHLAVAYRGALFHDLNTPASIDVLLAGIFLEVDLLLEAASWYSPQQFAFGATYDPLDFLTVAFDLTWYGWAAYPGPFVIASPVGGDEAVARALAYPPREDFAFEDILQPRFGVEARFLDEVLALRAGYSFRATPAPAPTQTSNLLDNDTHSVSFGLGYRFGPRLGTGKKPDPSKGPVDPLTLSVDGFVRYSHMPRRRVQRPEPEDPEATREYLDFDFGGSVLQAGVALSLGWD